MTLLLADIQMAEKTSGSSDVLVFLGIVIAFLAIVITILIGVTQFPDARRFVCSQWSYLCDRNNTMRFFAVDFTSAGDLETLPGPRPFTMSEGWDALMSLKDSELPEELKDIYSGLPDEFKKTNPSLPHECVRRPVSGCIDVPLAKCPSSNDVTVGQNRWTFVRVDDNSVKQQDNRTLIFDLHSHYDYPLKRDVKVSINVTAKLNGLAMPDYGASYQVTHPESTTDFAVSCQLYYPGVGLNEFEFHIVDDFFHADDPIHESVTVDAASR
jgi:hypothetical protein